MQYRTRNIRSLAAGFLSTLILATSTWSALAQTEGIQRPTRGQVVVPLPASPGTVVVTPPPGTIVVPPPTGAPVTLALDPPRSLKDAPPPQNFIAPGIEGIYAQLRRPSRFRDAPLQPYEAYQNYPTPPDASKFNLRQIVVKFVEGSAVRFRKDSLLVSADPADTDTSARLGRVGLEPAIVAEDLGSFNDQIRSFRGVVSRAAPGVDASWIEGDARFFRQKAFAQG